MEAAGNQDISQMVDEQGYLLRQHHDQLVQLGKVMEDVLQSSISRTYQRRIAFN
jgi:hypothetical protein